MIQGDAHGVIEALEAKLCLLAEKSGFSDGEVVNEVPQDKRLKRKAEIK